MGRPRFVCPAGQSTNPPVAGGGSSIGIGFSNKTDAQIAALIINAINAVATTNIVFAVSNNGQAGYDSGITAAQGSSDTQITLTMNAAGQGGNLTDALAYASLGTNIVDVADFTGGADNDAGRLSLAMNSSNDGGAVFMATLLSGSDGVTEQSIGNSITVADSAWHHYAFSFKNASAGITSRVYVDGALNQDTTLGSDTLNEVTGALQATIWSTRHPTQRRRSIRR